LLSISGKYYSLLRNFGNLHGVMEIWAGLTCGPVSRLAKTFAELHKDKKYNKIYEELTELTNGLGAVVPTLNPPVIPYLGIYLSELILIEENPKILSIDGCGLINWLKCRNIALVLKTIIQYQQKGYALEPVDLIQEKLKNQVIFETDEEMFSISRYHEPTEGREPGPKPQALIDYQVLYDAVQKSSTGL